MERWVSGLNQQFAKLRYWATGTGGSNPPLSASKVVRCIQQYHAPFRRKWDSDRAKIENGPLAQLEVLRFRAGPG